MLLPPGSLPLTHWNMQALAAPLFNPQTGAPFRLRVARQAGQVLRPPRRPAIEATRYDLTGETDLSDWYDAAGVWCALVARAADGSRINYWRSV